MASGKHTVTLLLLLSIAALPACDSNEEDPFAGTRIYELRVEGTEDLLFSCTITLVLNEDTSSATFEALSVPDDADLGFAHQASAKCTKLEELGLLSIRLFRNGLSIDSDATEAAFGTVAVADTSEASAAFKFQ